MSTNLLHYSIDLETLGISSKSYILSIGCTEFNIYTGEILDTFYSNVHSDTDKYDININTIKWWMSQDDGARSEITNNISVDLSEGLHALYKFIPQGSKVWGHGSIFDISILDNAYATEGIQSPWLFFNVRDSRTIIDLALSLTDYTKEDIIFDGTQHNALHDSTHQAKVISHAYNKLKGRSE